MGVCCLEGLVALIILAYVLSYGTFVLCWVSRLFFSTALMSVLFCILCFDVQHINFRLWLFVWHLVSVVIVECLYCCNLYLKKVAHTRLPSVGFRSWSQFLAVILQLTWLKPVGCCHYFRPGLQLPPQLLRGLLPILLLGEQNGCEQFAS